MFRDIYDDKHGIFLYSNKSIQEGRGFIKKAFMSEYEGELLCLECDNLLNHRYEAYSKRILYDTDLKPNERISGNRYQSQDGLLFFQYQGIDYTKFKLFLLSILYRASISKRPFFEMVKLSPEVEEDLREMIFNQNPGEPSDYPVVIMTMIKLNTGYSKFVGMPTLGKDKNGNIFYRFPIAGLVYFYYITRDNIDLPAHVTFSMIKRNNELNIVETPEYMAAEMLKSMLEF